MAIQLMRRRHVPVPTLWGWALVVSVGFGIALGWVFGAESFLAVTQREDSDVLVVEAWIGYAGLDAAKDEFLRGHYRYIVSAGGKSDSPWDNGQMNYADEGARHLAALGLPASAILIAHQVPTTRQRTFATAAAAWRALDAAHLHPAAINVFTLGAHARRSRLIFSRAFSPAKVGVIAWIPPDRAPGKWWQSSIRAEELIKESVGYLFERLMDSGRSSNSPR
ncbi:MAG TPA: ElyC/SanA/YdcF family protein [Candidatus Didemnitutus sp.]|nr:ElyC/SanA/YdcF family protein [Candidatus Didemnitutus sp.]